MPAPAASRPIRVLAVDHTAGVPPFRKKFAALARHPGIDLEVLAPERWVENYRVVRAAPGQESGYRMVTGKVGWPGYENRAFFVSGLGTAMRRTRPDVLHLWEEPFSVITLQALALASIWAPRAKAIFFSFDNLSADFHYSYRPSAFYAAVERLAHRRCVAGTAATEEVAGVLRAKGFSKSIEIVPPGLELADFPPDTRAAEGEMGRRAAADEVRARFQLNPPVVGFVGRLLHQKGVDLLIRAVASMREPRPGLVLIGDGPDKGAFVRLAEELGIGSRTRFVPMVAHDQVPALLASLDVLVLPSRTTPRWKEQFGRVLIEGMAAGCVVVGSSSGAIPEVMGGAGIVFPEEDAIVLGQALERIYAEPGLADALRIRGRARVRERFTWEAIASHVVDLYRRLAGAEFR